MVVLIAVNPGGSPTTHILGVITEGIFEAVLGVVHGIAREEGYEVTDTGAIVLDKQTTLFVEEAASLDQVQFRKMLKRTKQINEAWEQSGMKAHFDTRKSNKTPA